MENSKSCHYCDGKGYIDIRDCVGDIQCSENCSFCGGTGVLEADIQNEDLKNIKYNSKNH